MNLIDNIKNLWGEIDNKTNFIKACAVEFKRSEHTIHNHWFARFWLVPKDLQKKVLKFMQNYIALQNGVPTQSEAVK